MLDIKWIVANEALVEDSLRKRGGDKFIPYLKKAVLVDTERRNGLQEVESLKAQRNQASMEIAKLKKEGKNADELLLNMKDIALQIKKLDDQIAAVQTELQNLLYEIPNVLDATVPKGQESAQNQQVREWGKPKSFSFPIKSHDELGESLGIIDFKKAGEVSGARFAYLKGKAARLERALMHWMMDTHAQVGYQEIWPPFLVNRQALTGTGQLPKFAEDVFHIEKFDYFLIPTAEVPVTNYHRDEILEDSALPQKYVAYSPCFRSEAGSYGKDTKGLKRQHQFDKVELVKFVRPENGLEELETLLQDAEKILQLLELPYRVVLLCSGDIGFSSHKTYDLEVWIPSAKTYMEISSCSTFGDYQARRANIRYRDKNGKVQFVHTLNGSALAVGRTLIAIMENYQKADGDFEIPNVLKKYF